MNKLTPTRYEVQLVYKCPDCNMEHYSTVEETVFPAGILCYCGCKMNLEPIKNTKLILNTKSKTAKNKKSNRKNNVQDKQEEQFDFYEDLVSALVNAGHKKRDAIKRASDSIKKHDNLQDCLMDALSY